MYQVRLEIPCGHVLGNIWNPQLGESNPRPDMSLVQKGEARALVVACCSSFVVEGLDVHLLLST
jgi:hypothetical protein